ncbi:MAG: TerB N-terminal domain-containing protein [Thermomicrobiales bacterium]
MTSWRNNTGLQATIAFPAARNDPGHDGPMPISWVPPGQPVQVHGVTLIDGMVYVGQVEDHQPEVNEPSAIDPTLPVKGRAERSFGDDEFWLSYTSFEPETRRDYLRWLASGRRDPDVTFEYILLFLFGLERRVCVDIVRDRSLAWELPLIRDEVSAIHQLLVSSRDWTLDTFLEGFLGYIDLVSLDLAQIDIRTPPPLRVQKVPPPVEIGLGLGTIVARKQPIPAEWALAWAWYLPDVRLRLPATRAPEELGRLFILRYGELYGEGMTLRPGKKRFQIHYQPENFSLGMLPFASGDLPDVFLRQSPARKLADLFDNVMNELDTYSRWLSRNPEKEGTIAALTHLPARLLREARGEVTELLGWFDKCLGSGRVAAVDPAAMIARWSEEPATKLSKADSLALAKVFQRFDIGIEPDVRFGGVPLTVGKPTVLYRIESPVDDEPSAAYAAAATMAHLGAAVLAASGPIPQDALADIVGLIALADALPTSLPSSEMARLHAFLVGLATTEIKLTGLKKRLEALTDSERTGTGDILIAIATRDGAVSPPTVTILMKIFKLLNLDPEIVTSQLHAAQTGHHRQSSGREATRGALTLDRSTIAARERETSIVSDLLGSIFADADSAATPLGVAVANVDAVAGLDAAHTRLLRALAEREIWTAAEFSSRAANFHLLASGAIDVLNEAAIDLTGDSLIAGDDPLTIDLGVLRELLQ